MGERLLVEGNDAVGYGAVEAGCDCYFGYPITPQNEIIEWFSRELPKRGGVVLQAQSETGAINMVQGAAATGARVIITTSGPGWSLMQEGMSNIATAQVPCVVVSVQRGGPGTGGMRQVQMDYDTTVKGGGHGDYKNIVLAPSSVQETYELVQLAFHLADKYRIAVVVLSDALIGQMMESLELKKLDFGPLPSKDDWVVTGKAYHKDGVKHMSLIVQGVPDSPYPTWLSFPKHLHDKFEEIEKNEVRYETVALEDAALVIIAFGYMARISKGAIKTARAQGLKVGLIRPITLWPFPKEVIRKAGEQGVSFLVVEDNMGQMIDDVKATLYGHGQKEIRLLNILDRSGTADGALIAPGRIVEECQRILEGGKQ
jgi:2-oxoglutarate ferredoxin oxidoreductase subunit alpha